MKNFHDSILKKRWEESYSRYENFVFYPREEIVIFLNRFVRKRIGTDRFMDIIDFSKPVRGLDFGCGIGRQTILMKEFGIDAYGLDISSKAIGQAKKLAVYSGYKYMNKKFKVIDNTQIPFQDNFFDITICVGVLDSMYFKLAKKIIKEFERVTSRLVFICVMGGDDDNHKIGFNGEILEARQHARGTIRSYYNWDKIQKLIFDTNFKIAWSHLVIEEFISLKYNHATYYLLLTKNNNPAISFAEKFYKVPKGI